MRHNECIRSDAIAQKNQECHEKKTVWLPAITNKIISCVVVIRIGDMMNNILNKFSSGKWQQISF